MAKAGGRAGKAAARAAEGAVAKAAKEVIDVAEEALPAATRGAAAGGGRKAGRTAAEQTLIDELKRNGVKFSEERIVHIGRNRAGKTVFLETGNRRAGLHHILEEHADQFAQQGIPAERVGDYVFHAAQEGTDVGALRNGRRILEVVWEGSTRHVAVDVGSNGFIVGANPVGSATLRRLGM